MQPVLRSLSILTALASRKQGLGLQDLAKELDLPISTVHRLTKVLVNEGFVIRIADTKHFLLGPSVRALVAGTSSYYVREVAEVPMRHLSRATRGNVFLAELVGGDVVCFDFVPGIRKLRLLVDVGTVIPLHAGASARVILANLPPDYALELLEDAPLEKLQPSTMTDPDSVMKHLSLVRERGYDICDDEMEARIWAASAPVRDLTGHVRASVTVLAPEESFDNDDRREMFITEVQAAAARISLNLGFQPDDSSANRSLLDVPG